MPFLYLIHLQSLTENYIQYYAIISKNPQTKLDILRQGDFTGILNPFGLIKDMVKYINIVRFDDDIFETIKQKYKNNIQVISDENKYSCIIDGEEISISQKQNNEKIVYNHVGIYD